MIVLLTGAAGLLGGALAQRLLCEGHSVIALVHQRREIRSNDGRVLASELFSNSPPEPGTMAILQGDVAVPELGLDANVLSALEGMVDCIIHCAAIVRFEAAFEELEAVNVTGTRHVANVCRAARFIHVSTAYVCGTTDGVIVENPSSPETEYANGYERSKALAEKELLAIRPDALIVRPSIIIGEYDTGRIREFDTIYRAFKFIAEGRIRTLPVSADATLNFVPIDDVVTGIVDLINSAAKGPEFIHLAAREGIAAKPLLELIGQVVGLPGPTLTDPDDLDEDCNSLADRAVRPYWPYFSNNPQFEVQKMQALTGRAAPEMDEAAFRRQIEYCVDQGFIRTVR